MVIALADWEFEVDVEQTMLHTKKCSTDHCECAYCRNYYQAVDLSHPSLRPFMSRFGVTLDGPSELMPLQPTLVMACYRVTGKILQTGCDCMHIDSVPLRPEPADDTSFFFWLGEMELPWLQAEDPDDVVSPANEPEFLKRMMERWLATRETLEKQ